LALVIAAGAVLLIAPASFVSADTVKVYYQSVPDIDVHFPNGTEIQRGGELVVVTSSHKYDMTRTGIMFFECDPSGKPDMTTSITPDHYAVSEGNTVTHTFRNLSTSIDMRFTELAELEHPIPVTPAVPDTKGIAIDISLTTVIMLLSIILAAAMMVTMAHVIKMIDSALERPEEAS